MHANISYRHDHIEVADFFTQRYMSDLMLCGRVDFFHQVVGKMYPNLTPPPTVCDNCDTFGSFAILRCYIFIRSTFTSSLICLTFSTYLINMMGKV